MKKIVLFASGSGSNVENIVNFFAEKDEVEISLVLTNNSKAYVIERCRQMGVACQVFGRKEFRETGSVLEQLQGIAPDLIVLAGFLWLVPTEIVKAFPRRIINIHPALLPKYGGKGMYGQRVHQAVVDNQETETGITIHYVDENYDEGDVILQTTCIVAPDDSADDVAKKIHQLEYEHFPKVVESLLL